MRSQGLASFSSEAPVREADSVRFDELRWRSPRACESSAVSFSEQDICDLNQDGRRPIHEWSGRWSRSTRRSVGTRFPCNSCVEAVVRGRANGQIIEPLQKTLLIEEERLLAADLEVVVSRNIG